MRRRTSRDAELAKNLVHGYIQFLIMSARDITDMHDQRGFLHFLQRGAKSVQQTFRQGANKSHSVGEKYAPAGWQTQRANRGVKGGEHARRDENLGTAQRVKQRGFAGVGVADKRDRAQRHGIARLAPQRTLFAYAFNIFLDFRNSVANPAAICFQFFFARPANSDAAATTTRAAGSSGSFAALAGQRSALSSEPRKHIVQLRQLDLQLAFAAARMPRENIQDQLSAIDDAARRVFFDIALLHRRKVAIENNQRSVFGIGFSQNFIELAAADERSRIGFVAQLEEASGDGCTCAARQLNQLGERLAFRRARGNSMHARRTFPGDADEKSTFSRGNGLRGFHRARFEAKPAILQE